MPSPGLRASALRARARLPPLYWVPGSAAPQRRGVWGSLLPSALFSLPALNHSHQHEGALSTSHPRKKRPVCAAVPCWSLLSNLLSQNIYGNNGTLRKIGHLLLEGVQLRTKRAQIMGVWRRFILSEGKSHPVFTASQPPPPPTSAAHGYTWWERFGKRFEFLIHSNLALEMMGSGISISWIHVGSLYHFLQSFFLFFFLPFKFSRWNLNLKWNKKIIMMFIKLF